MSAWSCRSIDGKAAHKIVPPRSRIPCWKGPGADSEEKQELASDIDIAVVDSLKVLDPKRPIREGEFVCPLGPAVRLTARPPIRLFRLVLESHAGRALVPIPKRSKSSRATSTLQWWIV